MDPARHWLLVLEDEPRLGDELAARLAACAPEFGPVRRAASAEEAAALCRPAPPQIVFADIRLPGQSGLDFVQTLPEDTQVVFVTAHGEWALHAFEQGALDYLLKPVTEERLQRSIERLRRQRAATVLQLQAVLAAWPGTAAVAASSRPPAASSYLRWLTASNGRRTRLVAVQDIVFLQSDNKYTRLVCHDGEHLVEEAIRTLLPRLDPEEFRQIHRSAVVNLREVLFVDRDDSGGGTVQFRNHPEVLRVSAPFMRALKAFGP